MREIYAIMGRKNTDKTRRRIRGKARTYEKII